METKFYHIFFVLDWLSVTLNRNDPNSTLYLIFKKKNTDKKKQLKKKKKVEPTASITFFFFNQIHLFQVTFYSIQEIEKKNKHKQFK